MVNGKWMNERRKEGRTNWHAVPTFICSDERQLEWCLYITLISQISAISFSFISAAQVKLQTVCTLTSCAVYFCTKFGVPLHQGTPFVNNHRPTDSNACTRQSKQFNAVRCILEVLASSVGTLTVERCHVSTQRSSSQHYKWRQQTEYIYCVAVTSSSGAKSNSTKKEKKQGEPN